MADRSIESIIDELIREGRLSRRHFVGRVGAGAFAVSGAAALAGRLRRRAGHEPVRARPRRRPSTRRSPSSDIYFSNWPLYIDKQTIPDFEKEFDVKLNYTEDINDNNEFFGKVREQLQNGDPIDRDLVALTDWMAARWIESGYVEPLDKANIPNVEAQLISALQDPAWDPGRNFSAPWQAGMDGLGYNTAETGGELSSFNDIFDPQFKGRVSMLSEWRDSIGLVLQGMGVNTEDATLDEAMAAIEKVKQASDSGQIRRFTGNDYTNDLDQRQPRDRRGLLGRRDPAAGRQLRPRVPDPGGGRADLGGQHDDPARAPSIPYGAEVFINYVYEPEVAAQIASYVNYVTPCAGAKEILEKTDPDLAADPLIFPDEETLAMLHPFPSFPPEEEQQIEEAWQQVVGA